MNFTDKNIFLNSASVAFSIIYTDYSYAYDPYESINDLAEIDTKITIG